MAISKMQKISILTPKESVDEVLKLVQASGAVQLIDSNQLADTSRDNRSKGAENIDLLHELDRRLSRIDRAIDQLEEYIPSQSFKERMSAGKLAVSSQELDEFGQGFDDRQVAKDINDKIERLRDLKDEIEAIEKKHESLLKWRDLAITPAELKEFEHIQGVIGTVPATEEDEFISIIKNDPHLRYETVYTDEDDYGLIIFSVGHDGDSLDQILRQSEFVPFRYESKRLPADQIQEYEAQIQAEKKERDQLRKDLKHSQDLLNDLKLQYEYLYNHHLRESAKERVQRSQSSLAIQGWVQADKAAGLADSLEAQFGDQLVVELSEVSSSEIDQVPTKLENNWLTRPFEMIVKMYGIPNYDEIDPTPFVMPFFAVFFGMMLADFGYGLVILVAVLAFRFLFKQSDSSKDMITLVSTLAISTMIWGLLYGSFFGFTIESIQVLDIVNNTTQVMGLSVAIGIVHLLLAFGINVYLQIRNKEFAIAFAEGLSWMLIIISLLFYLGSLFIPALSAVGRPALIVAGLSLLGIFVAYVIDSKSIGGLGRGLLALIDGVSYFGDVISYTRLMALGLSGVSIGSAFNLIVGQFPPAARFTIGIVIFIGLHLFNMFLSVLTGAVHSLRLIFVEFFGKFYTGQGQEFDPLKLEGKYIDVRNQKDR